jgi:hypothetical protein
VNVVNRLAVDGSTALGPALAVALGLCGTVPGSSILCLTDGEANCGIGSLSDSKAKSVYSELGEYARAKGVQISITSFRNTSINSDTVGQVVSKSGGKISICDVQSLSAAMEQMASPIVGSCVEVMLRSTAGARFYDVATGLLTKSRSSFAKLGSAMGFTDHFLSFEVDEGVQQVTFQLVVTWKTSSNQKWMRVLERTMDVESNRKKLETTANMQIVGVAAVRRAASLAATGQVMDARISLISALRLLQRGLRSKQAQRSYINFIIQGERLDGFMREMQAMAETKVALKKDDYVARNIVRAQGLSMAEFCVV